MQQKLIEQGYSVESRVTIDQIEIDLLARKDGKASATNVTTTKEGVLSSIMNLIKLKILPEIDFINIAAPNDVLTEDIHTIAKHPPIGIGLIRIVDNRIDTSLAPQETLPARLTITSYSCPSSVVPREIFDIRATFGNSGGKIARNIEAECTPIGPFEPITERIQKIEELLPGDRAIVNFRFRVEEGVHPGSYFIFMKWTDQITKGSQIVDIEVKPRSAEYIERLVADAVAELDRLASKNVEDLLTQIEDAVEKGYLEVEDHIYDKSIWNTIGMAYLNQGLLKQAELVYRSMLKTLEKYEASHDGMKIHKGLAFHNFGIVLYRRGKMKEAKEMLLKALEEDKRTYGPERAAKGQAKKALDELQFNQVS